MTGRKRVLSGVAVILAIGLAAVSARAEPVNIRLGHGAAAEEPLWLLMAKPDMFKNAGKVYKLEGMIFPAVDKRAQAFEAGALDMATFAANAALFAAAEGVQLKALASISKESTRGFTTTYYALADSGIKSAQDLKGKTIGISGFSGTGHLWAKVYLEKNGIKESEVNLVPIRFPAMAEALASKKIDVGMFPQPFAAMAEKQMKVQKVFTAKDAVPFDEELMLVASRVDFLKKNDAVVRALLADLQQATKFYAEKPQEARQILIDAKFVRFDPAIYLTMFDYLHDVNLAVDNQALERMQELQMKAGFQKKKADIEALVDNSYIPK